ncbi:hypothetical protein AJ80_07362 [Polytolypa hystricis UAMH7299]|uniref:WW domain-containing protein n=1 Tax=Polytolypa hystricis (strain UAMH7299) TaxID=1447883 RepID=A0A2B7XPU7_POLH7|nr:hypothetical protein AJ80_07362 [Polytolypa hystricis UAMH7299]
MSRNGNSGEEMFLTSPSNQNPPPNNVSPLRIVKRDSPSPGPGALQPGRGPSSPPPTAPLPYPDDRQRLLQQQQQARPRTNSSPRLPYPDNSFRPSFAAATQPGRTTSPPVASNPSEIPSSLRPKKDFRQHQPSLGERRAMAPKPLPDSPGPEAPDKEGLFQRPPQRGPGGQLQSEQGPQRKTSADVNPYPEFHLQHWPSSSKPPTPAVAATTSSSGPTLQAPAPSSINRLSSTASTSTTKAQRGSPPPPETPVVPPNPPLGSDIEARYAASGIAGPGTLSSIQAHSAAAQQRANQYASQQPRPGTHAAAQHPIQRPWTPTEQPGSQPHGPPTVYQGPTEAPTTNVAHPPVGMVPQQAFGPVNPAQHPGGIPPNALEEDIQRLHLTSSPPPAYSTLGAGPGTIGHHGYPNEKQGHHQVTQPAPMGAMVSAAMDPTSPAAPINNQTHPAFANDPRYSEQAPPSQHPGPHEQLMSPQGPLNGSPAPPGPSPASPPPLPEGWIAHIDPNSGQYYYIHLPTQSTQWEFPKGPTPLNLNDAPLSPGVNNFANPLASPGLSTFGTKPLASPGLSTFSQPLASPGLPMGSGYEGSIMGMSTGYTGPPPASGVELYKVTPTNGVYFGPYLRYTNMDMERGLWVGSILLVTDAPQPPTIHLHQSVDLSPNPRQLKGVNISVHQRWTFYKYAVDLPMEEGPAKWTYAITSHLGCTRYEFLVAGRQETNWRFIATSGNDFSLGVGANERARVGGIGYMWKDIMQKHVECGGFHAQLGLGGQINADRLWKEIPALKQWLTISGKETRKNAAWTAAYEDDVTHAYFHYYTSHFDQPHLREAFAQIPHVCQIDDHDIFDGFGSYPDYMQFSNMFKNIGRIGVEMYLLFQHHTTLDILRNVDNDFDLFTITGTGWHFVKYLGPAVVVVGPDCRSERNPHQVMAGPTYQGIFPKVATLPPSVQHCIWMISVPLVYPRMESAEHIAQTMATGKKAVTGAYNVLGRVTSSVAGVVGAKGAVGSGFESVKRAVGKSGLMGGVLSPFGDIDILDELKDQWTHETKDLERTYLIRTLQGISHQKSIRMTFLSGSVNCCGAGILHDPSHPTDHKTMYQIISSSVVNTPPPSYIMKLLHNNKPLYVPANGQRSTPSQPTDTKEDMMEIFQTDVTGAPREHRRLMGRRNYVAIVGYDPDNVHTAYTGGGAPATPGAAGQQGLAPGAFPKLSLAVDFLAQGDGAYGNVVKFGPVIVPSLDLGR